MANAQKHILVDTLPYTITPVCGRRAAGLRRSWQLL